MFPNKFVDKFKTHILCSIIFFFFRKSCRLYDNVEKFCTAGQATDENKCACALHAGYPKLHTHTHTLRICTIYRISTATTVARMSLSVTWQSCYEIWKAYSTCF